MESLPDETFLAETAAQIYHSQIKHVVSVAEISQVYEITFRSRKDGIAVLQVTVNGGIGIGGIGYKLADAVFLGGAEERVLREQAEITLFYALKLSCIHMD